MKKFTRFVALSLVLVLVLSLVGTIAAQDDGKVLVDAAVSLGASDVPTLDPTLATDTSSIQVLIETHPGLTRVNELTLVTEPGMATWEVSEDGMVYTFSIIPDVPWVKYNADSGAVEEVVDGDGNVRYVTAEDFAYGIRRSASNAESYYGGIMASWIANGSAVFAGEADVSELGVEVVDTYTLQITASEPAAFLTTIYGMWQAYAQPSWLVDELGDLAWTGEEIQSYGPFAVKEWVNGESVTLVKNPFWVGTETIPAPKLDEIEMLILDDSAALANFEANAADISVVPTADIDRIKADADLSSKFAIGPSGCTYVYGFNTAKEPTDDVRVRRALSMAVDRQSVIDNVLKGGQVPAFFFSRPDLAAAPTADAYPEYVIGEDLDEAKALLQEYLDDLGYDSPADMPPITLAHNESEGHARIAQAIQQMWTDNLGVTVEITTQEWGTYLESIKSDDAPQVFRYGWCLDYPDTHNFLFDVFHSSVRDLGINWDSPEFDSLLEQAKAEPDLATRVDLYAQAENLLSNQDAAIIPIYYYTSLSLTQPWVERTYSQFGQQYYEKWDIDMAAKP